MGRCIYMCSQAPWNYLLYEAFALSSDREVMVLNLDMLDGYDRAMDGSERNFILFNPTPYPRTFLLRMQYLPQGEFGLVWQANDAHRTDSVRSDTLSEGVTVTLQPLEHMRLRLEHRNARAQRQKIDVIRSSQNAIIHAYALLQQTAAKVGTAPANAKRLYLAALKAYQNEDYGMAYERAKQITDSLQ